MSPRNFGSQIIRKSVSTGAPVWLVREFQVVFTPSVSNVSCLAVSHVMPAGSFKESVASVDFRELPEGELCDDVEEPARCLLPRAEWPAAVNYVGGVDPPRPLSSSTW